MVNQTLEGLTLDMTENDLLLFKVLKFLNYNKIKTVKLKNTLENLKNGHSSIVDFCV